MKKEAQLIVIAKIVGWNIEEPSLMGTNTSPSGSRYRHYQHYGFKNNMNHIDGMAGIPDYLNDLNAMHEAEKVIYKTGNRPAYENYLRRTVLDPWHATAAQRAEAFLGVMWKRDDDDS